MTPKMKNTNTLIFHDQQFNLAVNLLFIFPTCIVFICMCAFELYCRHAYYAPQAQLNILLTKTEGGKD